MTNKAYGAIARLLKGAGAGKFHMIGVMVLGLWVSAPAARAETLTLLALGDSLTAGYGVAQGQGFVPQLEAWLRDNGQDIKVINAGVSGDTTAGGKARLGWSLSGDVDMVLVNLGGNDMLRGLPPSETRRNLDGILAELGTRNLPAAVIRVPGSLNFGAEEKAAYDAAFPELAAQYDTLFIPNFFEALQTSENSDTALQTLMQPDGLHPTTEGVALIVAQIGPVLSDWISTHRANH